MNLAVNQKEITVQKASEYSLKWHLFFLTRKDMFRMSFNLMLCTVGGREGIPTIDQRILHNLFGNNERCS